MRIDDRLTIEIPIPWSTRPVVVTAVGIFAVLLLVCAAALAAFGLAAMIGLA